MEEGKDQKKQIKITFPDAVKGGVYSNNLILSSTKDEFILDFVMVAPPNGTVNARVITAPGNLKRMLISMQKSIKQYEDKFGEIPVAKEPPKNFYNN